MIELTIMGSKAKATFKVDKIVVVMPFKVSGTTLFTVEGAEWVVAESYSTVLAKIELVKGAWLK